MEIKITLSEFIQELKLSEELDRKFPNLDQCSWLLHRWSFEDSAAHYPQNSKPDTYAVARAWLEILKSKQ